MSILDRLKSQPPWKDPDPLVRIDGIDEIPDEEQELLVSIAREDDDPRVRQGAVARLSDHTVLTEIARTDADQNVTAAATEALQEIAIGESEAPDPARCLAALDALSDPRQLAQVAKQAVLDTVGLAAIARLTEPKALASVAKQSGLTTVRLEATSRIGDVGELASIAQNSEHKDSALAALDRVTDQAALKSIAARAKVKVASRRAKSALRALEDAEAQPSPEEVAERLRADRAGLCHRLESRASSETDEQHLAEALSRAETQWARLIEQQPDQPPEPEVAQQFETACRQAQARLAELAKVREEQEQQEAARAKALEPYSAICERLDSLTADTENARERLAEATAAWEALPSLEGPDTVEVATRYQQLRATLEAALEAVASEQGRQERIEAMVVEAEALAGKDDTPETSGQWAKLRRDLAVVRGTSELPEALVARLDAVEKTFAEREARHNEAESQRQQRQLNRFQQIASRLEALVGDSELTLKAAERALREIRTTLDQLTGTGRKSQSTPARHLLPTKQDRDDLLTRFRAIHTALVPKLEELRQADDWLRWANAGVQEQLCARMEALVELDDLKQAARQLRALQQEWKKVKTAPRDRSEALWHRFKKAQDAVREHCQPVFVAQAETKGANLKRKEELCEQVEALADSSDWIRTADKIKKLQAEWKTVGPAFQEKATWDRFRKACDRFFTRRKQDLAERRKVWAANMAAKVALCEQVEALLDLPEIEATAAQLIKRLQVEWKATGPVQRSKSEAVWKRFRTACDQFFERYHGKDQGTLQAHLADREAICTELESLLPADTGDSPPEPPDGLAATVRTLRQRWSRAGAPARAQLEEITARFDRAMTRLAERFPAAFKGTELDPEANARRLEKLCERVESFIEQEPDVSSTASLAERLKEALAANTIGGRVNDESRWRTAADAVKEAQAAAKRIGPLSTDAGAALMKRFRQACDRFFDQRRKHQTPEGRAPQTRGSR